jgi:hypothetical protein
LSDGVFDRLNASAQGLSHRVFDLSEGLLDRVEIGTLGRQEEQPGADRLDAGAHRLASGFMILTSSAST